MSEEKFIEKRDMALVIGLISQMSPDQLEEIRTAIKNASREVFKVGNRVTFNGKARHARKDSVWEGTIVRVNPKTLSVDCDLQDGKKLLTAAKWRVFPGYGNLRIIEKTSE